MKPFEQSVQEKDYSNVEALVRGNTEFALDLYQKLRTVEGNLFFSPYSISTALAMTYAGARGNTEAQMSETLHFTLGQKYLHPAFASLEAKLKIVQQKGHIQLKVANSLWPQVRYPFLEEFLALTKEYYGVLITPVDYRKPEAAREIINAWVEEKTQGKIGELIPSGVLDPLTRLVLTNAIYFKGNWASQFDKTLTANAPFWVTPAEAVKVPMMAQKSEFRYAENDTLQILELPYVGNDLSLIVLLPKKVDGLTELEDKLTVETLREWTSSLWRREVQVFLPRFRLGCRYELSKTLKAMGMTDAFDSGKADFSGMDGRVHWLYIFKVFHNAFIDVNEEGAEATAATAVIIKARSRRMPTPPETFRADHPFIFLVRENSTGSILFLGRVVNPMQKAA